MLGILFLWLTAATAAKWSRSSPPPPAHLSAGKRAVYNGQELVYHLPEHTPRGLLFVAHGCNHNALDFGLRSKACIKCIGLPVETQLVETALARGFAVLAVSAEKGKKACWKGNSAQRQVVPAIAQFIARIAPSLQDKPVFALGASSGGNVVAVLGMFMKLTAIQVQISHLHPEAVATGRHPPASVLYMTAPPPHFDEVKALQAQGIPAELIQAQKLSLSPTYFSDRSHTITPSISRRLFEALQRAHLLTDEHHLRDHPSQSNWREVIRREEAGEQHDASLAEDLSRVGDDLIENQSGVSELLNLAYAQHEITAEHAEQTWDFFQRALERETMKDEL